VYTLGSSSDEKEVRMGDTGEFGAGHSVRTSENRLVVMYNGGLYYVLSVHASPEVGKDPVCELVSALSGNERVWTPWSDVYGGVSEK